jgi:hypothetical protein
MEQKNVVVRLLESRKFIFALLAMVGVFVLVALGRITWAEGVGFVTVTVPAFMIAVAIEDAANKKGSNQ